MVSPSFGFLHSLIPTTFYRKSNGSNPSDSWLSSLFFFLVSFNSPTNARSPSLLDSGTLLLRRNNPTSWFVTVCPMRDFRPECVCLNMLTVHMPVIHALGRSYECYLFYEARFNLCRVFTLPHELVEPEQDLSEYDVSVLINELCFLFICIDCQ